MRCWCGSARFRHPSCGTGWSGHGGTKRPRGWWPILTEGARSPVAIVEENGTGRDLQQETLPMPAADRVFAGSIPEVYDRLMVPLIFEPYASDLAERLARLQPINVLEIAAGTGVLTRALAARLPAQARIIATDLNQPMLDHAA